MLRQWRRVAKAAVALARRAMVMPALTSPTMLAAGNLDGLFLVAIRPSSDSDDDRDEAAANGVGGRGGGGGSRTTVSSTYHLELPKNIIP